MPLRAVLRDDLSAGPQVPGTHRRAALTCPACARGRGSQAGQPAGARLPFNVREGTALPIVETRAITGGVDTHADVHVAAALDPVGGLLGVREFPVTPAGYASRGRSRNSALAMIGGPTTGWRHTARSHQLPPTCTPSTLAWPGRGLARAGLVRQDSVHGGRRSRAAAVGSCPCFRRGQTAAGHRSGFAGRGPAAWCSLVHRRAADRDELLQVLAECPVGLVEALSGAVMSLGEPPQGTVGV
jgi:hypothetical protein